MNFEELNRLIQEIKSTIPCRNCGATYEDKDIRIVGTVLNEGYFMSFCQKCKTKLVINVIFKSSKRTHRSLEGTRTSTLHTIDANDVLDMRNFLRDFNGDFSHLFGEKK